MSNIQQFTPGPVDVPADSLLRLNGYKDLTKVKAPVRAGADYAAAEIAGLTAPRALYRYSAVKAIDGDALCLDDGTVFRCDGIAELLPECQEVAVFVLSAGGRLDDEVRTLSDRFDLMEALFLETAGWLVMEHTTKELAAKLREEVGARQLRLIRRLDPGCSYTVGGGESLWPIGDLAPLLGMFAGADLPVNPGPGNVMTPKMSRAGLYGLAPPA